MLSFDEFVSSKIGPPGSGNTWTDVFENWPNTPNTKQIIKNWVNQYDDYCFITYVKSAPTVVKKETLPFRIINSKKSNALL